MKTAITMASMVALYGFSAAAEEPSAADEPSYPNVSGELSIEIENDWTYKSDDPDAEINDLYPTIVLGTAFTFSKKFSVNLEATLEPVEDATSDRAFEDLGGYLNILTANYDSDNFGVYAGKFTPNFGIAWDAAPGIYGVDLNEDYEFSEMIGFGGYVGFHAGGEQTISASTFFQDTTFLSNSIGTERGHLNTSDGGPANTDSLSSYALALDGGIDGLAGFRYHAGFTSLAAGDGGNSRQYGYVASAEYAFEINEDTIIAPIVEYAYFDNAGGINDDTAAYLTAGAALNYQKWVLSSTYQQRNTETGGVDTDDYVVDVTVGYLFDIGFAVAAAWRVAEEDNIDSQGFGLLASYAIDF